MGARMMLCVAATPSRAWRRTVREAARTRVEQLAVATVNARIDG
jgi:hypothetical protein